MTGFVYLAICAVVVQFVTERVKGIISEAYRADLTPLLALLIGIVLAVGTRMGLMAAFDIVLNPIWIDYVITGIAYSGGAVAFNELVKLVRDARG